VGASILTRAELELGIRAARTPVEAAARIRRLEAFDAAATPTGPAPPESVGQS
jgi:hypothetical protein